MRKEKKQEQKYFLFRIIKEFTFFNFDRKRRPAFWWGRESNLKKTKRSKERQEKKRHKKILNIYS